MIRFILFVLIFAFIFAVFGKWIWLYLKRFYDKSENKYEGKYLELEELRKKEEEKNRKLFYKGNKWI